MRNSSIKLFATACFRCGVVVHHPDVKHESAGFYSYNNVDYVPFMVKKHSDSKHYIITDQAPSDGFVAACCFGDGFPTRDDILESIEYIKELIAKATYLETIAALDTAAAGPLD